MGTEIDSLNFVTEWQDGPSQVWLTVTDSSENWVSELCDGEAGRTFAVTMARHRMRNPRRGQISVIILRGVLDYSCFNYKVSGLILISLITWGLKEVTLS